MDIVKKYTEEFTNDILYISDDMLYVMGGENRTDLTYFLNSNVNYMIDFKEKLKKIYPLFHKDSFFVTDEDALSSDTKVFMSKLKVTGYFERFTNLKYRLNHLIDEQIEFDKRDMLYFFFITFGDHVYDEGMVDKTTLKNIYKSFVMDTILFDENNIHSDIVNDIKVFMKEFKNLGINIIDYHDGTKLILDREIDPQTTERNILYNRIFVNAAICLGAKYTKIKALGEESSFRERLPIMLNLLLFGVFFDDLEDREEDLANNAPTYITWLYKNCDEETYIKKTNQIIAYCYLKFYGQIQELQPKMNKYEFRSINCIIELFKALVLISFDTSLKDMKDFNN